MNSDQCARGPNGELLDASQIQWFNDPDDIHPISNSAPSKESRQRPVRARDGTWLAAAIASELTTDDYGNAVVLPAMQSISQPRKAATKHKRVVEESVSDAEDGDFFASSSDEDSNSDVEMVTNNEIADMLPSKTIPDASNKKGHGHMLKPRAKPAPPKKRLRVGSVENTSSTKIPAAADAQMAVSDKSILNPNVAAPPENTK
ncbi:uncharacterized protein LACBIDRAFT_299348 [Laccaria bicolor S238N-H82]|uniref:Predicted protein n=1 Tax=Laccaria bicolor (strain S238N-H82 / ATCC MYA-4686) TaxID=486041 RepID=B0DEJ7_LACBS|nr:uncharacterized protein LACBIDRAFT_299348 [Laccaria bicolor S238N-H82]EDR07045.1 predicted protein [Laccaria bicolor S238N-H82]|eukprot:XP_001882418.1 predicted protein [Laccaria bicolor S238N-H82]